MSNTVYISAVIDAPVEEVWKIMRDYNGMPSYHPGIKHSLIEDGRPERSAGCVRRLTLAEGFVREVLLSMDDRNYIFTYEIVEGTLPVRGYVAGVRLQSRYPGQPDVRGVVADFEVVEPTATPWLHRSETTSSLRLYRGRSETGWKAFPVIDLNRRNISLLLP